MKATFEVANNSIPFKSRFNATQCRASDSNKFNSLTGADGYRGHVYFTKSEKPRPHLLYKD